MESPSLNPVECRERCVKKLKRKQFDMNRFELNYNCNESFLKQCQGGNEDMDGEYKLFLEYLTGCVSEPRTPVGICNEKDEEEEDVDPDYRLVKENLTVCGKSYALKVHEGGGLLVLVKYEGLDDSDEYWDWPARRKLSKGMSDMRSLQVKKRKNSLLEKVLRRGCLNPEYFDGKGCLKRRRVDTEDNRISEPHGQQRKSIAEKESRPEPLSDPHTLRRSRNDTVLEKVVAIDLMNAQSSRKAENRRILRSDSGKEKETVGEMKLGCESQISPQASRKLRNVIERGRIEVTDHFRNVESDIKLDDRRNLRSEWRKERAQNLVAEKELRSGPIDPVSQGSKGSSRPKHVMEDNDITRSQHNCVTEDIEIDECYQLFLNGIEQEGDSVVFVRGGERVRYEEDDIDCASDSEILMWDNDPYSNHDNHNPFVPSKVNASINGEDSKEEISLFRRKVMSILKRPYDFKEYKDLSRKVKERKHVQVHKELRMPKSVPVKRLSRSYLDYHQDVERKLYAVRHSQPKMLNILRGFFLWLENVSNEGVFKPWLDPVCLGLVPPCK